MLELLNFKYDTADLNIIARLNFGLTLSLNKGYMEINSVFGHSKVN